MSQAKTLKILWLSCSEPPPELMTSVSELPALEQFSLGNWMIGERDLEKLASAKHLKELSLIRGLVSDPRRVDLSPLAVLMSLETLRVDRLRLTPSSLQALRRAPRLRTLWLVDCQFDAADLNLLRQAKPKLHVFGNPGATSNSGNGSD